WILGGGEVKEENLPEDRDKLEHWYRSHGFRDMRVVSTEFVPGSRKDRVILNVTIDEGRRYWFGRVAWSGNQIVSTMQLPSRWGRSTDAMYALSRIEHGKGDICAAYAEQGYLYIGVEPRETVRDSIVDVTFFVTEGKPSNIRYVVISGNKGTREKVIRREVA